MTTFARKIIRALLVAALAAPLAAVLADGAWANVCMNGKLKTWTTRIEQATACDNDGGDYAICYNTTQSCQLTAAGKASGKKFRTPYPIK